LPPWPTFSTLEFRYRIFTANRVDLCAQASATAGQMKSPPASRHVDWQTATVPSPTPS
jgi:hypothetical protein